MYLSIHPFCDIYPFGLSVHLSLSPSFNHQLFIYHPSICPSIYSLFIYHPSTYSSIHPSIWPIYTSVHPYIHTSGISYCIYPTHHQPFIHNPFIHSSINDIFAICISTDIATIRHSCLHTVLLHS